MSKDSEGNAQIRQNAILPDANKYNDLQGNQTIDANVITDVKLKELQDIVLKKVNDYKPEEEQVDENVEFHQKEMSTMDDLFYRFADSCDTLICYHGIFWSLGMGAALPGFCLVFGELIDEMGAMAGATPGQNESNPMVDNTLYMVYVAIGILVCSSFQIASMGIFSENVAMKFKIEYFTSALSKDAAFYDEQNPNEMASKINKEAAAVNRGTSDHIGRLVYTISTFVFGFIVAFYFGWKYSLILLGGLPFIMCVGGMWGAAMQSGQIEQMKAYAQSAGYAEQALQSIRIVHTYGNEALEFTNYTKYLNRARQKQRETTVKSSLGYAGLFGMIFLFYAGALYIGGFLRWEEIKEGDRAYSGGRIIAIMFCIIFGAMGMGGMGPMMTAIQQGRVACRLALDIIEKKPIVDVNDKNACVTLPNIQGNIEFKDVNFTYPTRQDVQVLKNFNCTFESGKTTALVGPSGSGKSTIIQLIERFYKHDSGSITVDGVNIENLDLRKFRRQIGYVSQEPVLFNTSIKENMKLSKPDATDQEIKDALIAANAWSFVQKIETGLDTIVGGSGGSLSGGQKQRVAIARAFLKKPKFLLLDEATSALDKINEKLVQEAIDNYRKTRGDITIIVIAHRLSTIRDADKIVVLVNGTLTEMGTHDDLMTNYPDGTYADFCKRQASAEEQQEPTTEEKAKEDEVNLNPILGAETAGGEENTKNGDKDQKKETVVDAETKQMLEKANEQDEKKEEEVKKITEPLRKDSDFVKVMKYNHPQSLIIVACIAVGAAGFCQPAFGWIFSIMMQRLTIPIEGLKQQDPINWKQNLQDDVVELVIWIIIMAGVMFFGYMGKSYIFGYLGENVTLKIRQLLYESILEQHIGWFDFQEHQSSVLTSVMASEASLLNGAASEALGPYTEAFFALFGGLVLGFYFCWQESLITLGCVPFIILGNIVAMELEKKQSIDKADDDNSANLMIGDAINNLRTVQSFGYEDVLIKKYSDYLYKGYKISRAKIYKSSIAFGLSQCVVYLIFAALFYFGGLLIEDNFDQETMQFTITPENVFIALFAIFFGASQAGTAMAMGPDMAKATAAATKIFKIIETPSQINAVAIDKDPTKKKIDLSKIEGKIEFKNVWFRYPTRKTEFVLKGLTLTINPFESVALVGESGCGKSTFVSLLMRFYDPDFGEILLDGVNIQEYNLHDLRKALSLVMQEPSIFNYSIRDNILYGKLNAANSEILEVSNVSNCSEFVEKGELDALDDTSAGLLQEMKNKKDVMLEFLKQEEYDRQIDILTKLKEQDANKGEFQAIEGDIDSRKQKMNEADWKDAELVKGFDIQCGIKGCKLSGGQKQRVAIARTLIGRPKVLLLDEATSALDETSQKKVQQAIEAAMQNRTTIVIAHRMSTIEKCSKIFVLEDGKVKEEGAFNELKAAGGAFTKLAQNKQE